MKRALRVLAVSAVLLSFAGSLLAQARVFPPKPANAGKPRELKMQRARSVKLDLRKLPFIPPAKKERFEREAPPLNPVMIDAGPSPRQASALVPASNAPAPAPNASFDGLDFNNWGAGHPPDTNGDAGPQYYIETINTSIGIYDKTSHARVAAFTFDTFMSQGAFGNLCDTDNFGDPVVLYDSFEDRWVITDFAFKLDGSNNVINPPGNFQCLAVSMTGDPVAGGWNFYSINTTGGLGDYPKLGVWPDGIYMSVNMFDYAASGGFQDARLYAFNKAQMYAGDPTVQVVSFDAPPSEFTMLPSNARLQTGTPPAGTPNYFSVVWNYLNAVSVYKFHVDWSHISLSTLTGPFISITGSNWAAPPNTVSTLGGASLDTLAVRLMVQNQYSNLAGSESLWDVHTVQGSSASQAVPRYYQVDVTGGTIAANTVQTASYNPDALSRWMGSVAVNRLGDMALGYSAASTTMYPAIRYAGRLAGDTANTITLTDRSLIDGTGTQTSYTRWGDYSAMTLDPDGCTFWYTNEYFAATGVNYLTRIGSFIYPGCTGVTTTGTIQGTVTVTPGGAPISGATVLLGMRSTTTNASGVYSFPSLPPGTYPALSVSAVGYNGQSVSDVPVTGGGMTTRDFALTAAPASACPSDTTQTDFQAGVPTNVDLTTAPGSVTLVNSPVLDQQNTTLGNYGAGITTTTWGGQTFTPSVSGQLTRADINLFCAGCTGTTPDLTLSVRATSAGVPTGSDLASGTITGFSYGGAVFYSVTFSPALPVSAGTMYALAVRPTANPSAGTYAITRSGTQTGGADVYAGGTRVSSGTSGSSWSIPTTGGVTTDAGFKVYVQSGYAGSGNLVSSLKDANPSSGTTPSWSTISWNGTVPANTALQFQVAASNSSSGPFNFVGPDGTAGTFFTTSGASLAQFNGWRYVEYKAYLSTTNSAATPTLNDVTICYSNGPAPIPPAPNGVVATANSSTSVSVSWNPVGTATGYKVFRKAAGTAFVQIGTPAAAAFTDNTAAANAAYLYMVHAVNGSGDSADSAADLATTVPFTDDPLVGGTTFVLATHLTEIRTAVNAVHLLAGLGAVSFTDAIVTQVPIKAVHVTELRTALDAARSALSLPAVSYTDPTITGGVTAVKAAHFMDLRGGVK